MCGENNHNSNRIKSLKKSALCLIRTVCSFQRTHVNVNNHTAESGSALLPLKAFIFWYKLDFEWVCNIKLWRPACLQVKVYCVHSMTPRSIRKSMRNAHSVLLDAFTSNFMRYYLLGWHGHVSVLIVLALLAGWILRSAKTLLLRTRIFWKRRKKKFLNIFRYLCMRSKKQPIRTLLTHSVQSKKNKKTFP